MSSEFSSFVTSAIVEIFAGPERKKFLVHLDVLNSRGGQPPYHEGQLALVDRDEETVGRLIEYVYTGDYYCPDPVPLATPVATPDAIPGSEQGDRDEEQRQAGETAKEETEGGVETGKVLEKEVEVEEEEEDEPSLMRPLTPLSRCLSAGPDPENKLSAAEIYRSKHFDPVEYDYEDVLLAHAKIYVLARDWDAETLCTFAAQRLLRTLINMGPIQSHSHIARNFVELARYIYTHTHRAKDPVRRIVSQFAALNLPALQAKEMKVLIREVGEFASDLMEKACRRLVVYEKDLEGERMALVALANAEKESASLKAKSEELERELVASIAVSKGLEDKLREYHESLEEQNDSVAYLKDKLRGLEELAKLRKGFNTTNRNLFIS